MVPIRWRWEGGAASPVATEGSRPGGSPRRASRLAGHQIEPASGRTAPPT